MYYVMQQTLVSTKYQVVIPKEIRRKLKVKPGQRMNVHAVGEQIILSKLKQKKKWDWPDDYIKNLPNPWKGENVDAYLEKERNSWE